MVTVSKRVGRGPGRLLGQLRRREGGRPSARGCPGRVPKPRVARAPSRPAHPIPGAGPGLGVWSPGATLSRLGPRRWTIGPPPGRVGRTERATRRGAVGRAAGRGRARRGGAERAPPPPRPPPPLRPPAQLPRRPAAPPSSPGYRGDV